MHMPFSPCVHLFVRKLILYQYSLGKTLDCEDYPRLFTILQEHSYIKYSSFQKLKAIHVWNLYFLLVEMDDKITVAKTVNSWNCLGNIPQCILLIGPSHTGRTTFAELVRKYCHNSMTPGLSFDSVKSNYNLEGVISSKSIKIQTAYPALYEKSRKDNDELRLVDVPSFIYPPENKKWGPLEQKLTVDLMVARTNLVGFLIFIEEKSTRTNIIPWKKAILGFLELFRPESLADENLLDSIGMAITKAPAETKEETMVARLKQMQTTLVKEKHPLIGAVDRIIKNIIEHNRIIIFKKSSEDEAEKEGIISNMAQLEKMANYRIARDHIKQQPWQPEGEKTVLEYFTNTVKPALESLAELTRDLLALPDFSPDSLRKAKQKWREIAQDITVSEEVKQRLLPQDPKGLKYFPFVKNYAALAKKFTDVTPANLEELIQAIAKLGFFDKEDHNPFQAIFEGFEFKKAEDFKPFELENFCKPFGELFSEGVKTEVFKKLALAQAGNERKDFYEDAIEFIRTSFSEPPAALVELQETYKKKLIKFANPKEALQLYAKQLAAEKNKAKQFALANDVALILSNKGLLAEAGQVYRASRSTDLALKCLKQAAQSDQKITAEYVNYLTELTLFENAVLACYEAAGRFGYESREVFNKSLKEVETARKKYFTEGIKVNDFSLDVDSKRVIEVATSSLQKL